jgi:cell division protein FtsL
MLVLIFVLTIMIVLCASVVIGAAGALSLLIVTSGKLVVSEAVNNKK